MENTQDFIQGPSTSGSANLPDTSAEKTSNNKGSTQFKSVSNQNGIFRALRELQNLQEIVKPETPEEQYKRFAKGICDFLRSLPYDRALIVMAKLQDIMDSFLNEN